MLLFFVFFSVLNSQAQIAVTVDNPTNTTPNLSAAYTSLALALTDLNAVSGITGPVTLILAAGSETTPATGLTIGSATLNPVLSAVNNVKLVASGSVILNAGLGTATPTDAAPDGILKIVGADWITLDGITFTDGNVANPATMEFGLGLFKLSLADGASNNTIKNCIFNMQRINNATSTAPMVEGAVGILMINAVPTAATTALVPTTAAGSNSNNKFYTNAINGGNIGMALIGYAASSPFTAADSNNDVGGNSLVTGNTILNFGGGAATNPAAGIRTLAQYGINVSYNTVNNNDGAGVNHAVTLRGIYLNTATSASANITFNTVTVKSAGTVSQLYAIENFSGSTAASNTININNNNILNCAYTTATSATFYGIRSLAAAAISNIIGNTVSGSVIGTSGVASTATFTGVYSGAATNTNINNNTVFNNVINNQGGTMYCVQGTTNFTATGNNIYGNSIPFNGGTLIGIIYGIIDSNASTLETITNNNIYNLTISGNSTSTGSNIYGIFLNTVSTSVKNLSGNVIYNLAFANSDTGAAKIYGLNTTVGATVNIFKNKIYDLSSVGAGSAVSGLTSSGTTTNVYNNIIGDLRAPSANAANPLNGINITGGTTVNAYYNTVYLNGSSSGALFGSSAISVATGTTVDLRNNIFVNNSTVSGAGLAVAYRRSSTTLTSYAAASNNNLFFGSNIYTDGTNTDATLGAFKTRMATRDAASISENPNFVSLVGSSIDFLHINTAIATQIESGAAPIATYTDDFDGNLRNNASTPDIGADEFAGITPSGVINNIGITPLGNQCVAISRNVTANTTAGSNDITSVTLNYSFNGVAQTPITMTEGTLTAGSTSTFIATIPVATPANASVTWDVTILDPLDSKSFTGTSYKDEPLFGKTATANATVTSICNSGSTVLSAIINGGAISPIGTGTSLTTDTEELTAFSNRRLSYRYQIVYTAAELMASGIYAGPINSLAFNISTIGDSASNTLFTLKMGTSASATLTGFIPNGTFTTVFPSANFTHAVGLNVITFSTPYVWDGISNVVVEVTHNGINAVNNAQTYYTTTAGNTVVYAYNGTATGTTSNSRFNILFSGNNAPAITNYSWSDGSTVVGTGNNLSVSPTVNTTYTATLTSSGCTINTNAVAVTVNTTAAPTGSAVQTFIDGQTLADIVVTGTSIVWYASAANAATATNPLSNATLLVDDATYYATQTVSGCPSTASLAVTVDDETLAVNGFDTNAFKLYPNPVNNTLNVSYAQEMTTLEIFNFMGQQVFAKKVNATTAQIDMSVFAQGAYFVKVSSNEASKTIKVIKN